MVSALAGQRVPHGVGPRVGCLAADRSAPLVQYGRAGRVGKENATLGIQAQNGVGVLGGESGEGSDFLLGALALGDFLPQLGAGLFGPLASSEGVFHQVEGSPAGVA